MFEITTKLTLKNYFIGTWVRAFKNKIDLFFVPIGFAGSIFMIVDGFYPTLGLVANQLILFILVYIPILRFLYAKFSWKVSEMTYFFNEDEFGYTVGNHKYSIKKEEIISIRCNRQYIVIKLQKYVIPVVGDEETVRNLTAFLRESAYKDLLQ